MGILESLWNIRQNLHMITSNKTRLSRTSIFLAYLKLILKSFLFVLILRIKLTKENLFGFKVRFFSYPALIMMFDEIFIKKEYYFNSEKKNPFVIDCGANIGLATLFFKKLYPQSRIIAFEADVKAFELLKQNVENNRLKNVELHNKALYNKEGKIKFYYDPKNPSSLAMSTEKKRMDKAAAVVSSTTLSSHINEEVDFLKMDIEGAEGIVIEEMSSKNKLRLIKEMVIEYHHHIDKKKDNLSKILGILEKNNFGYHISSTPNGITQKAKFQDILIYAYHKNRSQVSYSALKGWV